MIVFDEKQFYFKFNQTFLLLASNKRKAPIPKNRGTLLVATSKLLLLPPPIHRPADNNKSKHYNNPERPAAQL